MNSTTITIQIEDTEDNVMSVAATAHQAMEEARKQKVAKYVSELSADIKKYSGLGYCRFSNTFKDTNPSIIKAVILYFRKKGFSVVKAIGDGNTIIIDWEYAE